MEPEVHRNAARGGPNHRHRVTNVQTKKGEYRTCSSGDTVVDRQTRRQTDRQTRSSQYSARLSGAVQQRATVLGVVQIVRRSNEACDSVRLAYRSVFIIMTLSDTAIRTSVCLSVGLRVCLSTTVSPELHVRYSQDFACTLPVSVVRSSSGGVTMYFRFHG